MPTMQEYLEEMARRQALGWTPGVPSRFTAPVAASWNLPTTARTTMRKAVPKTNLGDIAAASADPKPAPRRGRPRLTPEEIQRTASRQGMGTIGKTVKAIAPFAKVAGPIGLAYDVLRSEPAVASTEVPPGGYFYERQAYPSMAVEEGYPMASTTPTSPSMNVDYGPALQAMGVAIPPADLGVTTQPTTPSYPSGITPTDSIIPVDDLGGNDSIDVQTQVDTFAGMPSYAGMAEVPEISVPESLRSRLLEDDGDLDTGQLNDIMHHLDMVFGTTHGPKGQRVYQDQIPGFPQGISKDFLKSLPQSVRDTLLSIHDPVVQIELMAPYRDQDRVEQDIQDLVNNRVAQDLRNSGFDYQTALNSPNIATQDQVSAAAALARTGDIDLSESLPEMVSQVDTFKDIPAPVPVRRAPPVVPAYSGPTKAELQAAAAAQRKADLAEQKAAARRTQIARQALKDSQAAAARAAVASAAQAKSAQKAAKAVLARMSSDRNAPSQAEINAAIEVMSQVDTFGGGSIGFDGGGFDPQGGTTGSSGMGAWT